MEKYFRDPIIILGIITLILLLSGKFLNNQSLLIAGKYLMYFIAIVGVTVPATLVLLDYMSRLKSKK